MRPQDIERIAANVAGSFTGAGGSTLRAGCGALSSPIAYDCDLFSCSDDYECGEQAVFACREDFSCDQSFFCGCGQFEGLVGP
ncbi:MAG: hypothetical protein P9M08_07385 [Candidatus Erginobacter occultus]|nr:hypothetical protein [Candidatus Erginobacter occultus]